MPLLQVFSKPLLPDIGASSLQLVSQSLTDFQSKSGVKLDFYENEPTLTLHSAFFIGFLITNIPVASANEPSIN